MPRQLNFVGSVVPRVAPTQMIEGVHFNIHYDQELGQLIIDNVVPPESLFPVGDYILHVAGGDPNISIPIDGPFPYAVDFNAGTYPLAWAGKSGLSSWEAEVTLAARTVTVQLIGLFSEVIEVEIGETGTMSIPDHQWTVSEVTDFEEAEGIDGKFKIIVGAEVIPPQDHDLRVYVGEIDYTTENFPLVHTLEMTTAVTPGVDVIAASGAEVGEIVHIVLVWHIDGRWERASASIHDRTVTGAIDPSKPSFSVEPNLSGTGTIGDELTVNFAAQDASLGTSIKWFRGGVEIPGEIEATYTPVAADDQTSIWADVTAINAFGSIVMSSNEVLITYAVPVATGSISDVVLEQETGGIHLVDAAAAFTGDGIVYSVSGNTAVTIDAASGDISIDYSQPIAIDVITVRGSNSGGFDELTFNLTVNAQAPTIVWPADVADNLWPTREATPAEALAAGLPSETGHTFVTFNASIDHDPTGFRLRHALGALQGTTSNPSSSFPLVAPGATAVGTPRRNAGQVVTPRLFWEHIASATFKLAGENDPFTIGSTAPDAQPGTVTNGPDLIITKARVAAGTQPQVMAHNHLIGLANSAQSFTANPQASYSFVTGPGGNISQTRAAFESNSQAAYSSALAYVYTGQANYAVKAKQILDAWATRAPVMVGGSAHPGLHIGSHLTPMIYADDLLRSANYAPWLASRGVFEEWWRDECLSRCRQVFTEKMTPFPPPGSSAPGPDQWDSTNWLDHAMKGYLGAAIAFRDNGLRNDAIARFDWWYRDDWRIDIAPYGPGGTNTAVLVNDVTRADPGELQGVSYSGFGTSSRVVVLEMCRYCGFDFWNRRTPEGVGEVHVIQQWFNWNFLNHQFAYRLPEQNSGALTVKRVPTEHSSTLEIAYARLGSQLSTAFRDRTIRDRPISNLSERHVTLNKGDMFA